MIPEVAALRNPDSLIRIPPTQDVPITPRVRDLLDSAPVRRLGKISQLGMVSLVYPGATHSRMEHSIGVYHNAIRLLSHFADEDFLSVDEAESFVVAALLHDIGHWPYCHPIEDMNLAGLDEHENCVGELINDSYLSDQVNDQWSCSAQQITLLLDPHDQTNLSSGQRFLASCLSGPIDIDKLDYLQRDSLHAGVPYGRNFDDNRLFSCLQRHPESGRLAITAKGKTAAEMMVFARYVMFSEVYWHPAVRSATAMLQRSVFLLQDPFDLPSTLRMTDAQWIDRLRRTAAGTSAERLVEGLFGPRRTLFKQCVQYSVLDGDGSVHQTLAQRPFWWLVACAGNLASILSSQLGVKVDRDDLLIDAPPVKLEVDINIAVISKQHPPRMLGDVSPVTAVLAQQQFDNHVKRVRVFVPAELRTRLAAISASQWERWLITAAEQTESEIA